jgi:collagenase-like PrtC family protease
MLKLSVGCDFSTEHVSAIISAIEEVASDTVKVSNVYGSPRGANLFGSVRPSEREATVLWNEFKKNVAALRIAGINIHITLNSLFPHVKHRGTSENIFKSQVARDCMDDFIKGCGDIGINTFIVAHPYLINYLHERFDNIRLVVSTILNVHDLGQIEHIKETWPKVIRICPALWKNRDYSFLRIANKIIPLELLANEFCSIGGFECEGLYRQSCYLSQSMETTGEYNTLEICSKIREQNPVSWLKARFILPQWMSWYKDVTSVDTFKITGRTHKAEFVKFITGAYLREKHAGNLLELWGHLQATLDKDNWEKKQHDVVSSLYLDCSKMGDTPYCQKSGVENNCYFCRRCENLFNVFKKGN